MRNVVLVGLVAISANARGDDGALDVRAHVEDRGDGHVDPPLLALDPILLSHFEGLAEERDRTATVLRVADTTAVLEGIAVWNVDTPYRVAHDVPSRGWRAAIRLHRDLGFARLETFAAVDDIQTHYGEGRYIDVGAALVRTFTLSRWMTAWISLSIGHRTWLGRPPPGEANATTLMLTLGTTFR